MTSKSLSDAVRREQLANPALPWLILGVAFVGIMSINPIGFIGGGWDDWQYLDAARCWRTHGLCLPHNHWQGRWPVIAPIALSTSLFGESRVSVGLSPLLASVWCVVLLVFIGNRLFKPPVGFVAAGLLISTAAFAIQLLDPAVEAIELGFGLTGVMALLQWKRAAGTAWPALAGLSFGLAFQVRETALVAAGFAGLYILSRYCAAPPREKLLALATFALPFLVEAGIFFILTGDPFYRRRLSLHHTQIPSSELLGPIDYGHSALFNTNYIANWRRDPGIHFHWSIDGLLNLYVNAKAGLGLFIIPIILVSYRRLFSCSTIREIRILYTISIFYMCILIYVLAVDPKPRIMFYPIAALSLALALIFVRLHGAGRKLVVWATASIAVASGLSILFIHQRVYPLEHSAAIWIGSAPDQIEIEENTRRHLTLLPSAERLPTLAGNHPLFLVQTDVPCLVWAGRASLKENLRLLRQQPMSRASLFDERYSGGLCLFLLRHPISGPKLLKAVADADWYGLEARRFAHAD